MSGPNVEQTAEPGEAARDVAALLAEIDRLRAQNKASSDAWTKRAAAMESEIARTKALFEKAARWVDKQSEKPWWTESTYGKYAAVLMMERAERAEAEVAAAEERGAAKERERIALALTAAIARGRS